QLATAGRPSQVGHWISRGRDFAKPPDVGKPTEFAAIWRKWWTKLQPDWRGVTWPLDRTGAGPSEDWAELLKSGRSGFEVIVITLSWWLKVVSTDKQRREWESAVEDVAWVLEHMVKYAVSSTGLGAKRAAVTDPGDKPSSKR
ncbi:hypothetical protein BV25DRAFT_1804975, partial [Artomyces pyxidatus]